MVSKCTMKLERGCLDVWNSRHIKDWSPWIRISPQHSVFFLCSMWHLFTVCKLQMHSMQAQRKISMDPPHGPTVWRKWTVGGAVCPEAELTMSDCGCPPRSRPVWDSTTCCDNISTYSRCRLLSWWGQHDHYTSLQNNIWRAQKLCGSELIFKAAIN